MEKIWKGVSYFNAISPVKGPISPITWLEAPRSQIGLLPSLLLIVCYYAVITISTVSNISIISIVLTIYTIILQSLSWESSPRDAAVMRASHMTYSLNSLKGGYIGDYIGDYYRGY